MFDTNMHDNLNRVTRWEPTNCTSRNTFPAIGSSALKSGQFIVRERPTVNLTPKILLYSHDTFGLGNIRRTLLLAQNLIDQYSKASILIITGSPVIHAFRLPEGIDYIKLPSLDRVSAERYEPLLLANCADEIKQTREAIVENIVTGFAPDLLIVDKRAAGINGELLQALKGIRQKKLKTKIVLGLCDILDAPERTAKTLRENGSFETIEKYYDEVWIYGSREIFDTAREYNFPAGVAKKTQYCGYLKRPVAKSVGGNGTLPRSSYHRRRRGRFPDDRNLS